ncbi:hypothetical protein RLOC_00005552 [Lonchura striata]|uniref:Uncharacterized protein n=1 Tax=Lonchura striata TaxID=40157 RepID=A0A218VC20_9PASE|nr:hypothetical protein RLOC_00005552 [Lonchura striata domestica]
MKQNSLSHQSSLLCMYLCDLTLGSLYCSTLFRLIQLHWDGGKAKCQSSKAQEYLTLNLFLFQKIKYGKLRPYM